MIINLKFNKFLFASFFIFTISNSSFLGMVKDSLDAAAQRGRNEIKKTPQSQELMAMSGLLGAGIGSLAGFVSGITCNPVVIILSLASNVGVNFVLTKGFKEFVSFHENPSYQASLIVLQNELPDDRLKHFFVGNQQMAGNIAGLAVGTFIGVSIYSLLSALFSKKDSKK